MLDHGEITGLGGKLLDKGGNGWTRGKIVGLEGKLLD